MAYHDRGAVGCAHLTIEEVLLDCLMPWRLPRAKVLLQSDAGGVLGWMLVTPIAYRVPRHGLAVHDGPRPIRPNHQTLIHPGGPLCGGNLQAPARRTSSTLGGFGISRWRARRHSRSCDRPEFQQRSQCGDKRERLIEHGVVSGLGEFDEWSSELHDGSDLICHCGRHQTCLTAQIA